MGAAQLWTADNASYVFTESTKIDPEVGNINLKTNSKFVPLEKNPESTIANLFAAMMCATLCNNSSVVKEDESSTWKSIGDPTEVAMLIAGTRVGISRKWLEETLKLEKIGEFAFDSDRKMMSVIYQQSCSTEAKSFFDQGSTFILAKGAPEGILKNCSGYLNSVSEKSQLSSFSASPLSDEVVENISKESSDMANLGLRVLALAMRPVTPVKASEIIKSNNNTLSETNLTFIGLIGLIGKIYIANSRPS